MFPTHFIIMQIYFSQHFSDLIHKIHHSYFKKEKFLSFSFERKKKVKNDSESKCNIKNDRESECNIKKTKTMTGMSRIEKDKFNKIKMN